MAKDRASGRRAVKNVRHSPCFVPVLSSDLRYDLAVVPVRYDSDRSPLPPPVILAPNTPFARFSRTNSTRRSVPLSVQAAGGVAGVGLEH